MINSKTIIFCAPADFGFSDVIKSALQEQGFTVYDFPILDTPYKYKRLTERLYNAYRKILFKDRLYKRVLKMRERHEILSKDLHNLPKTDYALFIRPDLFPIQFVKNVKNKTNKIVGYQWDGLQRFPVILDYIDLFDRFFVFDATDLSLKKELLPLTNFYIPKHVKALKPKSAYFVASYDDYRFELITKIKKTFDQNKIESQFLFITKDKKQIQKLLNAGLTIEAPLTYNENLYRVEQASILIDIHSPVHSGLSFRIFEALFYNKKLITTNQKVRDYDFYHPNNIFIWDMTNENKINDFLNIQYIEIPREIKYKYSFTNWINYVLDRGEYIPIKFPIP